GYTMKDISYRWSDGEKSVRISKEVELPQFKVLGHSQRSRAVALSTGNYSRLVCEIRFVRSMGYYLIQIYIPAGLIVVISWVSFWLHRNATPARVALGVTTVLTMTTLMSSTNAALPKISYVKSIDVYLGKFVLDSDPGDSRVEQGQPVHETVTAVPQANFVIADIAASHKIGTCFVMVFASLLEYATVGYLGKRIAMRRTRCQQMAKLAEQRRQMEQLSASYGPGSFGGGPPYGGMPGYGGPFSLGPSRMPTPSATTPHTPHYDKSCVSSPTEPTQQPHDISPPIVKNVPVRQDQIPKDQVLDRDRDSFVASASHLARPQQLHLPWPQFYLSVSTVAPGRHRSNKNAIPSGSLPPIGHTAELYSTRSEGSVLQRNTPVKAPVKCVQRRRREKSEKYPLQLQPTWPKVLAFLVAFVSSTCGAPVRRGFPAPTLPEISQSYPRPSAYLSEMWDCIDERSVD
ncbi:gamma-aminobutyric acid receptor subunit beta-like, partial [Tropilaelaps mercedesae]